jgi:hypothetical protein
MCAALYWRRNSAQHASLRAIRYMLAGGNPDNETREEIISPGVSPLRQLCAIDARAVEILKTDIAHLDLKDAVKLDADGLVTQNKIALFRIRVQRHLGGILLKTKGIEHPTESPAEPIEAQHSYAEWLEIISRRILARDGADEDYTKDSTEPLGWRTRNIVRVRITYVIHDLNDRYPFWHELSALLWADGWAGNTVFGDGRREAWIFQWTDPKTQPDRPQEMPEDWSPITDGAPNDGPAEPDVEPESVPEPKPERTLEDVLDKLVERIVMEPYGYEAVKIKQYPQQHTESIGMIKLEKLNVWQQIVEIGQARLAAASVTPIAVPEPHAPR